MKNSWTFRLRLLLGAFLLATTISTGSEAPAEASSAVILIEDHKRQIQSSDPLNSQIIIKYWATANVTDRNGKINTARMNMLSTAAGETLTYERPMSGDAHVLSLPAPMPSASVEAIARKLTALPGVEYAEPDYVMRPTLVPNDPSYGAQWHYFGAQGINAAAAWDITTGSAAIRVAVIDTGAPGPQ